MPQSAPFGKSFSEHQNVQWLPNTRAPDKGRDLSMERVISDGTGGVRTERVIVQAKHWQKSVNAPNVGNTLTLIKLWQPPVVRVLIMATSGTFSESAVAWVEQHNQKGEAPHIEMWTRARLETLLAQKPHLAAAHGLRWNSRPWLPELSQRPTGVWFTIEPDTSRRTLSPEDEPTRPARRFLALPWNLHGGESGPVTTDDLLPSTYAVGRAQPAKRAALRGRLHYGP